MQIKYLSKNFVLIHDWSWNNFAYDGCFRFLDPGRYQIKLDEFHGKENFDKINVKNIKTFQDFIFNELIYRLLMYMTVMSLLLNLGLEIY